MWQEDGSFLAQQDRMAYMALLTPNPARGSWAPLPGVRPGPAGQLAVTAQTSPNMTVSVAAGTVWLSASIAENAGWTCVNDGAATVSIAPADPTFGRIDLIVAHVYDAADDVGPDSRWALEDIAGTPALSPAVPAQPANSMILAQISVPAGVTTITSGRITDKRTVTVALGGILPCTSATHPPTPYAGQVIYETDTGQVLVYQAPGAPTPNSWQSVATGPGPWVAGQSHFATWTVAGTWTNYDIAHGGAGWMPGHFTVPPSGQVYVTVTAGLGNTTGTDVASIGFSINDPTVGDTGPNFVAFAGHNAVTSQDGPAIRASTRRLISGLTPGKLLTIYPGFFTNGGTPVDDGNGDIIVEAVP